MMLVRGAGVCAEAHPWVRAFNQHDSIVAYSRDHFTVEPMIRKAVLSRVQSAVAENAIVTPSKAGARDMSRKLARCILLLATGLAACAGRPPDVMVPVAAGGGDIVPVLIATTRKATPGNPGALFSGERSRGISYGRVDVSLPPTHKVGEIEWPDATPGDPARHVVVTRAERFDRAAFKMQLREALRRSRERNVLLFIHGYNNLFDDAVFRLAQIMKDSGTRGVPVLFTWPSRGALFAYPYERESATYSRVALEQVMAEIVAEPSVQDIAVLAHSMGNWVTLEALRQQAIRHGQVPGKIRNVMLAAPDVDIDVARTQIADLGPRRPRITLFVARDDRALAVSQFLFSSTARLGSIDPDAEPYRTAIERASITVVDLTKMNSGDPLHHAEFAQSPEVVQSIGARLAAGQSIETRSGGLGQTVGTVVAGATKVVGDTVAAAVSVPIAVVDPQAREDLSHRFRNVVPGEADPGDVAAD